MSRARVRVGVVGCGLIAQVMHLPHLRELSELYEVAAVCDISAPLAERVASDYGVEQRFQDWRDMLAGTRLDAVLLLTSGSHAPASIAASQAGLHVFTEKPMSLSAHEGTAMVDAARAAGKQLMVGYMKRYDPAYARLQEELATHDDVRLAKDPAQRVQLMYQAVKQHPSEGVSSWSRDIPECLVDSLLILGSQLR